MKLKPKTYTLKVNVQQYKKEKGKIIMQMHVKGCMQMIRRAMTTKNQQDLLDEYAKFYILDAIGVKMTPEEVN